MSEHKIMVIDDNAATRRMVKNALAKQGYEVLEAPDGATARELMAKHRPRIVLQDLILPDTDGFSLVGELRKLAGPEVAILAFSGFVSKLDQARISSVGFDDIIPKPIAPSRLLPLLEAHMPAPLPTAEKFGAGRRLVVADDDPLQLKLASFRLGRLGFEIETVPDGAAALAAVRRRRPDAIVSDVMMPELDGFGLAMALRQDPELKALPLVLVTSSYVEPSDRELAQRAGANELVVRTPELGELIELLRRTLTSSTAATAIEPTELNELERERNRRVFRQLERQVMLNTGLAKRCSALASELTVLTGISEAVLKHRDIDAALDEALAACFDAGGVSVGALYLLDDVGGLRVRTLGAGDGPWSAGHGLETFFDNETLLRSVMFTGKPLYVPSPDLPRDISTRLLQQCDALALLVVPLTSTNGPLGALLMVARGRELDEEDWRQFAIGVGTQISQVLTLARAYADAEAAERRAAEHAAVLEAVMQSAPDYVIQLDREGVIRFINRVDPPRTIAEVIGKNWFELLADDDQRAKARVAFSMALAGSPAELEIQAPRSPGTNSWFQARIGPIRTKGAITGAVMIARDITEKKQTEMQLMLADRMASVGTLAAGVAHEINNPLAAVIANLDMAVQDVMKLEQRVELPADLVDELRDAQLSADRVREIVRDLKLFSRTQEERYGAVNVEKVLESTLRMAWNEVRHRAKVVKEYGSVPRVTANESRLGQVLLNLLVNAVQAIPEGNYLNNEIRVKTWVDGDNVVIGIRDTGSGIPLDVQRRLFTPFFTTKPVGVGTGLGLAISHRIVTGMSGTITFDTELGKGTEFKISLPIAGPTVQPITHKLPVTSVATRRGRVLVIDDEESLGQAIRRYLSQDHDVEAVTSARVALDLLAGGARYDVILCDLMMPQITGMEVHDTVVKLDPAQAGKIVFVTGGAFTESARMFFENTANQRIEKPFDLKTLRHLVNELIH
ncbi:MAG TPA: response regulator [Kofleriaceae bacterium]